MQNVLDSKEYDYTHQRVLQKFTCNSCKSTLGPYCRPLCKMYIFTSGLTPSPGPNVLMTVSIILYGNTTWQLHKHTVRDQTPGSHDKTRQATTGRHDNWITSQNTYLMTRQHTTTVRHDKSCQRTAWKQLTWYMVTHNTTQATTAWHGNERHDNCTWRHDTKRHVKLWHHITVSQPSIHPFIHPSSQISNKQTTC